MFHKLMQMISSPLNRNWRGGNNYLAAFIRQILYVTIAHEKYCFATFMLITGLRQ